MKRQHFDFDQKCPLEKFPGKGGWIYVAVPGIKPDKTLPFGWVIVSGYIDDVSLDHVKLMPKGDGSLFLAVKASIRKSIRKKEGDIVSVRLFREKDPYIIPAELLECLKEESTNTLNKFINLPNNEQKAWSDWIYNTKKDKTIVLRIVQLIDHLENNISFNNRK